MQLEFVEKIVAESHKNILATHKSCFEIIQGRNLTKKGNCIIGTCSNKTPTQFSPAIKRIGLKKSTLITLTIRCGALTEIVTAHGDPRMNFRGTRGIIVRKSSYVCSNTIGIHANKSCIDFQPEMRNLFAKEGKKIVVEIKFRENAINFCKACFIEDIKRKIGVPKSKFSAKKRDVAEIIELLGQQTKFESAVVRDLIILKLEN